MQHCECIYHEILAFNTSCNIIKHSTDHPKFMKIAHIIPINGMENFTSAARVQYGLN